MSAAPSEASTRSTQTPASSPFTPPHGVYISFTLDVRRTLDFHRREIDYETEQAIKLFTRRRYVACVEKYVDLPRSQRPYHRICLRLLQQGLPDSLPEFSYESSMSYPVFPETNHPRGRPPVRTDRALPWQGCYHPSWLDKTVRLPSIHINYTDAVNLVQDDWARIGNYSDEDSQLATTNERKKAKCEQIDAGAKREDDEEQDSPGQFMESIHGDKASSAYDVLTDRSTDTRSLSDTRSIIGSDYDSQFYAESVVSDEYLAPETDEEWAARRDGLIQELLHKSEADRDWCFMPVVDFTPDLSGIPSLHTIHEFTKDMDELEALVKKCPRFRLVPFPKTEDLPLDTRHEPWILTQVRKTRSALKESRLGKYLGRMLCRHSSERR